MSQDRSPDQQNILVLTHPLGVGQSPHQFSAQAARMLVVNVFHDAPLLQTGRAKPVSQCAVLLPQPLLVDEQAEALLKSQLAHFGSFQLSAEGFSHSVQFHSVQFLDRWLVQYVLSLSLSLRGGFLLQQCRGRIVVMSAANVFMFRAGPVRLQRECGLSIQPAFQDGL